MLEKDPSLYTSPLKTMPYLTGKHPAQALPVIDGPRSQRVKYSGQLVSNFEGSTAKLDHTQICQQPQ